MEKCYENVNFQVKHKNMTPPYPKPYLHKFAHESLNELKALKEDCFAELLSRATFLQVNRGEFGKGVQP